MRAHLDVTPGLAAALVAAGVEPADPGAPTILSAPSGCADWQDTLEGLTGIFGRAQSAARKGASVVFVVSVDALLGRTGALDAMTATGVVSAARTLALELEKQGAVANCLGVASNTPDDVAAAWILRLLETGPDGPTGELVQLGGGQIGKALS